MKQIRGFWQLATDNPLTKDRPWAVVGRFVRHQLRVRRSGMVVHPWVNDSMLLLRPSMPGATGNVYRGLDEFPEMGFLLHFLRSTDLFFDVGANVGTYTILASAVCGARTVAFEPDPGAASRLRANVAVNGIDTLVKIEECAVSEASGTARLSIGLDAINHLTTSETGREVSTIALDDIPEAAPALIKIDVEGFEEQVLNGAGRTLAAPSLRALLVENDTPRIRSMLSAAGFTRCYYDPRNRTLSTEPHDLFERNALFVRDLSHARDRLAGAERFAVFGRTF